MNSDNQIKDLFDSLIHDKTEKKIVELIILGKDSDEIIEELLNTKKRQ